MKKLPSLFRKKYTAKKLEKKIYKKIFVPVDREYVQSLFEEVGTKGKKQIPVFAIPAEKTAGFTKKEFKRMKLLAKQIKKQKGRVNLIPLAVTLAFIAAIPVCFMMFKNKIVKLAITRTCESIFEARCDIEKVDFKLLDSSLRLKKVEIANKNDTMKNLVDIGSIAVDFDLKQLLKKHFVADELSVLEVNSGTQRKYDGKLPPKKQKKVKAAKEKKEKPKKDSKLEALLNEKKQATINSLEKNIRGLFNQVNPESLMNAYYAQLQTPAMAEALQVQIPQIVAKWEKKPDEIQKTVNDVQGAVNKVANFNYQSVIDNPVKIKEFLDLIDSTYKNVEKIKNDTTKIVNDFKGDITEADNLRKSVQGAVTHDVKFAEAEIKKIKSLQISDGTKLLSEMFENIACDVLGKYYPYVTQGVDYLLELKAKQDSQPKKDAVKTAKKKKGYSVHRDPGRDVVYRNDTTPKFWIKKMAGSGPFFYFEANDISSNQDLINKPARVDFNMELFGLKHIAEVVVDIRSKTVEPLIKADYQLKGLSFNIPAETFGSYPGVPAFESGCDLDFLLKIFEDEGFDITGKAYLNNLKITTVPFEPEFASKIYSNILARINTINASLSTGYTISNGLKLSLESDADKQIIRSLKQEMNDQLEALKKSIKEELTKFIRETAEKALGEYVTVDELQKHLNDLLYVAKNYETILNDKKAEYEKYIRDEAEKAKKQAEEAAKKEAKKQVDNAVDQGLKNVPVDNKTKNDVKNQLKKLF